jgi:hypothetical protein
MAFTGALLPDHGNTLTGDVISVTMPMAHSEALGSPGRSQSSCGTGTASHLSSGSIGGHNCEFAPPEEGDG